MAYHLSTPALIAGNTFRVTINVTAGLIVTPDYIKTLGWNGIKKLDVTILNASGKTVVATGTGSYALLISGFDDPLRQRITFKNEGNLFGRGGAGGIRAANGGCQYSNPGKGGDALAGGPALYIASPTIILNTGIIGGGGGGNGGDGATSSKETYAYSCQKSNGCTVKSGKGCNCKSNCGGCEYNSGGCMLFKTPGKKCCRLDTGYYRTTCYGSRTKWCPNSSGDAGANGSGVAGSNGAAASTGAGLGRASGLGIKGADKIITGLSVIGVVRGGQQNL